MGNVSHFLEKWLNYTFSTYLNVFQYVMVCIVVFFKPLTIHDFN